MSNTEQFQPHEQDDCEDCQRERAENNKLVDFYERLAKIRAKVSTIKPELLNHSTVCQNDRNRVSRMGEKLTMSPSIEVGKYDSKDMGYELACALLEREIKIKRENEVLSKKISHIQAINENIQQNMKRTQIVKKDSQMQSEPQNQAYLSAFSSKMGKSGNKDTIFADSLDQALHKDSSFWGTSNSGNNHNRKQSRDRYSNSFHFAQSNTIPTDSTTFTNFQYTGQSVFGASKPEPNKYGNLNLWLYQYNVEQIPVPGRKTTRGRTKSTFKAVK